MKYDGVMTPSTAWVHVSGWVTVMCRQVRFDTRCMVNYPAEALTGSHPRKRFISVHNIRTVVDDAGATNRLCWPSAVIMAGDGSGPQLHCARTRLLDILQGFDPQTGSDRTLHASGLRLQELTETTSGSWPRLCRIVLVTKYPLSRQIRRM
ncbi:hypothetical protein C0Q70_00985 [Pomacea canaliculata]|uniref:Uncharacterized protein n=1 Tax=Pomacea canaliculata TaxID=400727 RepID=A0A2T7PY68_POMCA|nr:hypothetical protein C0Q70_00985 [Pomacea canaliculata]